jgi:hypothetical protein
MSAGDAPISRGFVDEATPWLRGLLGLFFVAYSANSTIFIGAEHLIWLFDGTKRITIGGFPDAYWYSAALAAILFAGEVATGERYPKTYRLFLAPDVLYTSLGIFSGLSKAIALLAFAALGPQYRTAAEWFGWILAFPAAGVIGYFIAKWGEVLLFGKRRSRRSKREE